MTPIDRPFIGGREPTQARAAIVTLQMEADAAARFTALRQAHFPPERNWLDAHITLFHAVPLASLDKVLLDVAEMAAGTVGFQMQVDRLQFLGLGVAYAMSSPEALAIRRELADRWSPMLSRQDLNWRGPLHVTVQNKVSPTEARQLHAVLERDFHPYSIEAVGLQVWEYLGGPWRPISTVPFHPRPQ